jgi:hypothetical protein
MNGDEPEKKPWFIVHSIHHLSIVHGKGDRRLALIRGRPKAEELHLLWGGE